MTTDLASARTLVRETDEVLRRGPGLGTLTGQAGKLRAQLSRLAHRDHHTGLVHVTGGLGHAVIVAVTHRG